MTADVRILRSSEFAAAYELAWDTFEKFQAEHYPPEGRESFRKFLWGGQIEEKYAVGKFLMLGCFCGDVLTGIGGMRDGNHISLMFTKDGFHRKGIGTAIILRLLGSAHSSGHRYVTLNASPCGLPFYRKIGFFPTDMEQIKDGIIFTPMKYEFG